MYDSQKIISIALAEVGYKEKASNAQLDDKLANAGKGNFTKYSRDMDAIPGYYNGRKQTVEWCDIFVDWCFVQAYGPEAGRKIIFQPLNSCGAGCRWSRNYYKAKGRLYFSDPLPGDQIFFWPEDRSDKDAVQHTGLVYAVDKSFVYTVEGNVSSGVVKKKYALNSVRIAGYGRPAWDSDFGGNAAMPESSELPEVDTHDTIRKGAKGAVVVEMQGRLMAHGYTLSLYGADGSFGRETKATLKAFQSLHGLEVDGICGPATWAALLDDPESDQPINYTVTIPSLTKAQADALVQQYKGASAIEAVG